MTIRPLDPDPFWAEEPSTSTGRRFLSAGVVREWRDFDVIGDGTIVAHPRHCSTGACRP